MIKENIIFQQFKASLELGSIPKDEISFEGYKSSSKYYSYLKFLNFLKLNPSITIEHGNLLRQAIRYSGNKITNIKEINDKDLIHFSHECGVKYENGTLSTEPYSPHWLNVNNFQDALDLPPRESSHDEKIDAEIWVNKFNTKKWKSIAQREIFFKAYRTKKGEISILGLPTGSGKSFIFQLMSSLSSGLTLVIVPTIALAIDQFYSSKSVLRNHNEINPEFYSSDIDQERIIEKLKNGSCKLLFTSPESVVSGRLKNIISKLNSEGKLTNVFIDEAHMIETWGADFRIDFQLLPAYLGELHKKSDGNFKTFLLSATFSSSTKKLFSQLFTYGIINELIIQRIRPEVRLFYQLEQKDAKRNEKIFEAIKFLPRALIIYATKKDEVDNFYNMLIAMGYKSVKKFHGDTPDNERSKVLKDWRNNKIEIIIATSAFGMGVDKLDVRCVIHACFPESFHRYYQEIGRGGRDGLSSVSLFLPTPSDIKVAKSLLTTLLGKKLENYWSQLLDDKKTLDNGRISFYLNSVPQHLLARRIYTEHISWKKRLIVMLARYNLLEIIEYKKEKKDENQMQHGADEYNEYIIVKCNFNPYDIVKLQNEVEKPRKEEYAINQKNFDYLEKFLKKEIKFCNALNFVYGKSFQSYCTECYLCNSKNYQLLKPFQIKIRDIQNKERPDIIPLNFDINQYNSKKILRILRDLFKFEQKTIFLTNKLFKLVNDENHSYFKNSKPFRLILPEDIKNTQLGEFEEIICIHDESIVDVFLNFNKAYKVMHIFSNSINIFDKNGRIVLFDKNPIQYVNQLQWMDNKNIYDFR